MSAPRLVGLIGAAVAVAQGYFLYDTARQARTHFFTPAAGTVAVSRAVGPADDARWEIEYTYPAAGRTRTGRRVEAGFAEARGSRAAVERWAADHPPGGPVDVYYDPADPDAAVLEPGVSNGSPAVVWVLLFVQIFPLAMAVEAAGGTRTELGFAPSGGAAYLPTGPGFDAAFRAAGVGWFAFTFGFLFLVGPALRRTDPTTQDAVGLGYGAATGAVLLAFQAAALYRGLARPAVTVDPTRRTLAVRSRVVRFADIDSVTSDPAAGGFRVRLARVSADPLVLAEFPDWRDADALAGWVWWRVAGTVPDSRG